MDIILIEDNDDDATKLINFFRANISNDVRWIQDGADAARFLLLEGGRSAKLILLDIVLPSVDGIELFKIIRSEPGDRNISVIFLVSSQRSKEYIESLGLEPDGFLLKPRTDGVPARI